MIASNNHEYKFRIISFKVVFSQIISNQIRIYDSIKHELSKWLWKVFPLFKIYIYIAWNAKGKFNIFVWLFEWQLSELEMTPIVLKCAILFHTRNLISFFLPVFVKKLLRIIKNYLSHMNVVNMFFFWFSSATSIILIYFMHPGISLYLRDSKDNFHPSRKQKNSFFNPHKLLSMFDFVSFSWRNKKLKWTSYGSVAFYISCLLLIQLKDINRLKKGARSRSGFLIRTKKRI